MSACTAASHQAAVRDDVQWSSMTKIGTQEVDETEALEMRNCTCGSTLCRVIVLHPVVTMAVARALFAQVEAEMAVAL